MWKYAYFDAKNKTTKKKKKMNTKMDHMVLESEFIVIINSGTT